MKKGQLDKRQREIHTHYPAGTLLANPLFIERCIEWVTFFRRNITVFIEDYLGIRLHLYQVLVLHMMNLCPFIFIVAARATAKSFLLALFAVSKAILFPGSQIVIASATLKQARIIVEKKIIGELREMSQKIRDEIEEWKTNPQETAIKFRNGSTITVVVGDEKARGNRATMVILEECRMIPKKFVDSTVLPFLIIRQTPYMLNFDEYKGMGEEPITAYITSSWYDAHWMWKVFDNYFDDFVHGRNALAIGYDYALALRHGIKSTAILSKERTMSDSMTWALEYGNMRPRENSEAFFKLSTLKKAQKIKKAFHPQTTEAFVAGEKNPYAVPAEQGEVRLVSADLAFIAGSENDNSITTCLRLLPQGLYTTAQSLSGARELQQKRYRRQCVYMESRNGGETLSQAIRLKQIFYDFGADYLVLDLRNAGISIFDMLGLTLYDEERGVEYPPWTCINNDEIAQRVSAPDAIPCVYVITASAKLNSEIAQQLKISLANNAIELLVDYETAREDVLPRDKHYMESTFEQQLQIEETYMEMQSFIKETTELRYERNEQSGLVKVYEQGHARKDRYTSLSYANYIASILEKDLERDDDDYGFCVFVN